MTRRNLSDRLAAQSVIGRIIAQRGLTQSDVAARMGLSRQAVQRWAGGATPSLANLRKLADILDVPLKFLTGEVPFAPEALDALIEDSAVVAPLYDSDDLSEQGRLEQERGAVRSITLRSDTGIPGNARPVVVNVHDDAMWPTCFSRRHRKGPYLDGAAMHRFCHYSVFARIGHQRFRTHRQDRKSVV